MCNYLCICTAPSPPVINSVIAIDSQSVRVDWSSPNGIPLFYTITYAIDNGSNFNVTVTFNGEKVSVAKYCSHSM